MRQMSGHELRTQREQAGFSRPGLAHLAGIHPDTVKYWERAQLVDLKGWAPKRMFAALGVNLRNQRIQRQMPSTGYFPSSTRARHGVLEHREKSGVCMALTRSGTECRAGRVPGKNRCRNHGGLSTGPVTPEGRKRIAEAQKRRWAAWRANQS